MRINLIYLLLLLPSLAPAQTVSIIPQPAVVRQPRIAANFSITPATTLVLEGSGLEKTAAYFNDYLKRFYGWSLKVVKNSASVNTIRLNYERMDIDNPGAYTLAVDQKGVYIAGDNATGVFYGIQSLIQLLPVPDDEPANRLRQLPVAYVSIEDQPRFAYRGLHLDVCRHFWPVNRIKQYIDLMALHKLNYFHWHLTDDQGWRIEIKRYPKLTQTGAWRNGTIVGHYPGTGNDNRYYGGYYTQAQIREIVKYAADRFITVIPEIEMPGHSVAAIAAYPWLSCFPEKPTPIASKVISQKSREQQENGRIKLVQETWGVFDDVYCAGKDSTFQFLQQVLDEVIKLFPSPYIHIGGDECPKTNWKTCPRCQQRMKEQGLKNEEQLQSYFISRMEKYLNSKGRTIIGWDEILEGGLAPNAIVMSWRGEQGGIDAARDHHQVIMTPGGPLYFDHSQSEREDSLTIGGYNSIEKVYAYNPVPAALDEEQGRQVLGAQANLWTEYIDNMPKLEYMLLPRLSALCEILWSPAANRQWNDFEKRLQRQLHRYNLWKVNYSHAIYELHATVTPAEQTNGVNWNFETRATTPMAYRLKMPVILTERNTIPVYSITDPTKVETYRILEPGMTATRERMLNPGEHTIPVRLPGQYTITAYPVTEKNGEQVIGSTPISTIRQVFQFSASTGKAVSLTTPASTQYPGNGAFTLVDGVINTLGLTRSKEFLGFSGTDCEAVIDLGKEDSIHKVQINVLDERGSWIWPPASMDVLFSNDGINFSGIPHLGETQKDPAQTIRTITWDYNPVIRSRYVKVRIHNYGLIPAGFPGAGNKAWLFVDEIEIN